MKWLVEWFKRRKRDKAQARFNAGFDYAAGYMLQHGLEGIDYLHDKVDGAITFDHANEFDDGIIAAVRKYLADRKESRNDDA